MYKKVFYMLEGGWEISSPASKNIQDTEDDQDALLKKGPFEE